MFDGHIPTQGRVYVLATLADGSQMAYEISGASVSFDYEDEPALYDGFRLHRTSSPRMTVEGVMVQGRIWKPGDTFSPDEKKNLEAPRGELEQ